MLLISLALAALTSCSGDDKKSKAPSQTKAQPCSSSTPTECSAEIPGDVNARLLQPHGHEDNSETRLTSSLTGPRDYYQGDKEYVLFRVSNAWKLYPSAYDSRHMLPQNQNIVEVLTDEQIKNGQQFSLCGLSGWLKSIENTWSQVNRILIDTDANEQKISILYDSATMSGNPSFPKPGDLCLSGAARILELNATSTSSPASIEYQVKQAVEQLKTDPENTKVIFQGKTYLIGVDDIATPVNKALEESSSSLRCFFGISLGQFVGYYGTLVSEEHRQVNERDVRYVYLDSIVSSSGTVSDDLGQSDTLSNVIVFKRAISKGLEKHRLLAPADVSASFPVVHQSAHSEFYATAQLSEDDLTVMKDLVTRHEEGHLQATEKFGFTLRLFEMQMANQDHYDYLLFQETYADLHTIEYMIELSKTDPEKAKRAYLAWANFRYANYDPKSNLSPANSMTSQLLLSAGQVQAGQLTIDWNNLTTKTASLKDLLERIFAETTRNIMLDVLGRSPSTPDKKLKEDYQKDTEAFAAEFQKMFYGQPSTMTAERFFVVTSIDKLFESKGIIGVFSSDALNYNSALEKWAMENLGISKANAPFRAPSDEERTRAIMDSIQVIKLQ